jgi:hypothetical protein
MLSFVAVRNWVVVRAIKLRDFKLDELPPLGISLDVIEELLTLVGDPEVSMAGLK